eukprot:CAMPEP_0113318374 /NCGR_PEP_ID=MMETSP0010_2-20120614/12966_1 /TAXON_ID=216773 ORGANISM="Corethron hystrix, Strain 308" /NCGR_SAMPLE_ID=MMETSP0010_2 /ASSEMBLY_ACC=CAM_ASM_000155 /LENGTH=440 /DNA_ID=CAMNT_0000175659 /DNA_START=91 /DNA_END=1410 /DNA_ORIENTATION=+ /assembly_acc=CAM_ASM_000155
MSPWFHPISIVVLAVSFYQYSVVGTVIKDFRVLGNKNVVPVLGRGYSQSTNIFQAKCLAVEDTTESSYDFELDFNERDISVSGEYSSSKYEKENADLALVTSNDLSGSNSATNVKGSFKHHRIWATMTVDRYYSSVDESTAIIDPNIEPMLNRGDIIGVVSVCGPNFVRGIRRKSEVQTSFTYISSSVSRSKESTERVKGDVQGFDNGDLTKSRTSASVDVKSLKITIAAYGIDLTNMRLGDSLIARSMDDYKDVMETAFRLMQNPEVGVIASVEIVPWTHNIQFQQAMQMDSKIIYPVTDGGIRVLKQFPSSLKRVYYMANAEHIVKLDQISRFKSTMIQSLTQCMSILWSMSDKERCHSFVSHNTKVHTDSDIENMRDHTASLDLKTSNSGNSYRWHEDKETTVINTDRLKFLLDGRVEVTDPAKYLVQKATEEYQLW